MKPEEISARVENGCKFVAALRPPDDIGMSETADWQIIANAAQGLLRQIKERCPSDPLKVEAVFFVMRAMSVATGSFVAKRGRG